MLRETLYPEADVEEALAECKRLAYLRGCADGRAEAGRFIAWAGELNGSSHAVVKALSKENDDARSGAVDVGNRGDGGTDRGVVDSSGSLGESDDQAPDPREATLLALFDAHIEAKTHHADSDGGEVVRCLEGWLEEPDGDESGVILKAWDSSLHPRDDGGRFVGKEAIHAAKTDPKKAEALRSRVTDPKQREKLDAALEGSVDLGRTKLGLHREQTAGAKADRKASLDKVRQLANDISTARRGGAPVDAEHFIELAKHLPHLTIQDLRSTRGKLAASFHGGTRREDMVRSLLQHAKVRAEQMQADASHEHDSGLDFSTEAMTTSRPLDRALNPDEGVGRKQTQDEKTTHADRMEQRTQIAGAVGEPAVDRGSPRTALEGFELTGQTPKSEPKREEPAPDASPFPPRYMPSAASVTTPATRDEAASALHRLMGSFRRGGVPKEHVDEALGKLDGLDVPDLLSVAKELNSDATLTAKTPKSRIVKQITEMVRRVWKTSDNVNH